MEALQAVYASSDSSEDEEADENQPKDAVSSPRNSAPEKANLSFLPKKRTRESSPPRSSKRLQKEEADTDVFVPPFEGIERREQIEIDKKQRYQEPTSRKEHRYGPLLCPPRQVQTRQENISTEDLTSYGLKREQSTKNHP
ncbi:hypothetical protein FGB62_22g126 [Gracilaria domingensis]|nr:hypothetical protein FGB62_22g126 [Gracilaria domingensis]